MPNKCRGGIVTGSSWLKSSQCRKEPAHLCLPLLRDARPWKRDQASDTTWHAFHFTWFHSIQSKELPWNTHTAEKPKTSKQGRNLSAERWWFLLCHNHRLSQHNYTTSSPIAPANEERSRSSQNVWNRKRDWGDQMVVHVIWQSSSGDAEDGLWIEIPHFAPKHKQENSRKHNQHR